MIPTVRLVAVLAVLAGCVDLGGVPPDAPPIPDAGLIDDDGGGPLIEVAMYGLKFDPKVIEISPGTRVRWTNYDAVPHTVTEGDPGGTPLWTSPLMATGDVYEQRFVEVADWEYHCATHPNIMRDNQVLVR